MSSNVPSFYPCAFFAETHRIDCPLPYDQPVYNHDVRFFAKNKRRKMYLRTAFPGEFRAPRFYPHRVEIIVWVKQLSIGTHECVSVWVSRDNVPLNQTTDNEVIGMVREFYRLRGNERFIWNELVQAWKEYCGQDRPMSSSGECQ